jgi:hypothetical protein
MMTRAEQMKRCSHEFRGKTADAVKTQDDKWEAENADKISNITPGPIQESLLPMQQRTEPRFRKNTIADRYSMIVEYDCASKPNTTAKRARKKKAKGRRA